MNTTTLQKCVDELKKDAPNIPYILGMLETYIELNPPAVSPIQTRIYSDIIHTKEITPKVDEMTDEERRIAIAYERGQTGKIT